MNIKLLFLFLMPYLILSAQQIKTLQTQSSLKTDHVFSDQALYKANTCFFIQNKGQWDPEVKYLARINGMNAWITNSGVVYDYYKITRINADKKMLKMNPLEQGDYENKNTSIEGSVVKMELVNSEKVITSVGNDKREGYNNYFIGNDKSKWASFVPLYNSIELQGVYKNIDVKYYYDNGMLRYDYKVKPGANISQIEFKFEGQKGISINSNGELVLKTSIGEVINGKIFAYQIEDGSKKEVVCKFEQKEDGATGLSFAGYDIKKEIIIDPLVYSTFIAGSDGNDSGASITLDSSRNAYITGEASSTNFPTTTGAYQATLGNSSGNAFITKLNPSGKELVFSTYIGGNNYQGHGDKGTSIAIDANMNIYITGETWSSAFPTTTGAFQTTFADTLGSAFVTKLNSTGSTLVYSTYIGGDGKGEDKANSISVDANRNAYITGMTTSSKYPTTSGAFQTILGNPYGNVFVTKLNSTGTNLVYSTFIGGSVDLLNQSDGASALAIDSSGNAYITGDAGSSNYPTTNGAYKVTLDGVNKVFVTKLDSTGSNLVYSTFIGNGTANSIAIDLSGNAFITGLSYFNYPTTTGAFQNSLGNGLGNPYGNVIVTKLNPAGTALVYSTFIGGSGNGADGGNSITIDARGNAYITGEAYSGDYPTTNGAYKISGYGNFITELNSTGSALVYSSIIGNGSGTSISIDANGDAYITGKTNDSNYPTTSGAYQTIFGAKISNAYNVFVTKLNLSSATSVKPNSLSVPVKYELMQNYPNPFNPGTVISYALPFNSNVKIEIYNILGERIRELINEQKNAGYYEIKFIPAGIASGIYFYSIDAKSIDGKTEFRNSKKMILLK